MSRRTPAREPKRRKQDEDSESEDEHGVDDPIEFFIPDRDIDIEPLAYYLREFIDPRADIKPGKSSKTNRSGYVVYARYTISTAGLRDIMNDSEDWGNEQKTRQYRKDPYRYTQSDTARRRGKNGPTPGSRTQVPKPVKQEQASSDDPRHSESRSTPASATIPMQGVTLSGLQPQRTASDQQIPTGRHAPAAGNAGRGQQVGGTPSFQQLNIYTNVSHAPNPSNIAPSSYTGQYYQPPQHGSPPPAYTEAKAPSRPPNPPRPSQPGPGTYDKQSRPSQPGDGTYDRTSR